MADIREYNFIENIDEKIKAILKKLELSPKTRFNFKELKKDNRRFYFSQCKNKDGQEMFFKALAVDHQGAAKALKREIQITKKYKIEKIITFFKVTISIK